MKDSLQSYMQVGIVHFMAYPECMKGEGPIYDTLTKIVEDEFFGAVEISWIKDPAERARVKALFATSHMTVGYGAQPCLLSQKLNLNHFDPAERKRAVDQVKACIDEAAEVGAGAVAVLSGVDPGERREEAFKLLVDSVQELVRLRQGERAALRPGEFRFQVRQEVPDRAGQGRPGSVQGRAEGRTRTSAS